ncbi:MAG TPA: TA system VapC family ribonuclease toxin [Dehalococcoidia bacterium]|jgi:hypothetical protein
MPVALLDVNVLVALFDPNHIHNKPAHTWFAANRSRGWATCPVTENALIRILSNVSYSSSPESGERLRRRLAESCADAGDHLFWADSISLRDERFDLSGVSHRQLSDYYLLQLAVENRGLLATFDGRMRNVPYARAHLNALFIIPS